MIWNGTAHQVELRKGVVWLKLGGVTQPLPPIIAGEVARDLLCALIKDLETHRPEPTPVGAKATVPFCGKIAP